jgi:hypothetical protein
VPYGLDQALDSLRDPSHPSNLARRETATIFLDCGFKAWLAYFLATHYHGHHFKGQKANTEAINAFDQLSRQERTAVAVAVASISCHATVDEAIQRLMENPKRRREYLQYLLNPPSNTSSGLAHSANAALQPSPTILQTAVESPPHPNGAMQPPQTTDRPLYSNGAIPTSTSATHENNASNSSTEQTLEYASWCGMMDVFPGYMCSVINSRNGCADVTMSFPVVARGLKPYCLLSLVIKANQVEFIAWRLFQSHIRTEDGVRHFVLPNSGRLVPPSFQFQGSLAHDINDLLGPEVGKAIAGSPVREEEVLQGIVATRCVSMTLTIRSQDNGILNLSLNLTDGLSMKRKLYPESES